MKKGPARCLKLTTRTFYEQKDFILIPQVPSLVEPDRSLAENFLSKIYSCLHIYILYICANNKSFSI